MKIPNEVLVKALEEEKILPYELELMEGLREITIYSIPVSIVLLSKNLCGGECYAMSMNLTRGMDHFTLVHGDVNFIEENCEHPNHSWVEKDGYVYDTTDGFKWDKELYYSLFQPQVRETYDEESVKNYKKYQNILAKSKDENMTPPLQALVVQYIELLEEEKPYINKQFLFNEIEVWREKNNITEKYSDEVMKEYKKMMQKSKAEKQNN